ncbi:MAG: SDR family NAD(P)-dependent oxidoreductase, partial [Verrucomicrobiota bacterium]|nr:SDR family NAD(P)-dependent oxidoreductase [Verrucomicrobiota bacterium]
YRAIPLQSAYCAAKHAERGFTDSLRSELIHDGSKVHVTMVQLPALNTPQFGWVKSRLPRKAQPVPPIFQPEVAAEAIYWAAHEKRREVFVGLPTMQAILGNKVAPGLLDHYLAKAAYDGQQTGEPEDPNRPDNLMEPVPGDHGAHGTFGSQASDTSPAFWAVKHRAVLGAVAGGFMAVGLAALLNSLSRRYD